MLFYTIDDIDLYTKLHHFENVKWRQNCSFLMYKQQKGETIAEADGHYIMYVVENEKEFEKVCMDNSIKYKRIPVNEMEYENHFEIFRKGRQKLNEDLLHTFDELELFVQLIAKPNATLQITDSYSFALTTLQIDKISKWLIDNQMDKIEFIVPLHCQRNMNIIVSDFNSKGINVTFKTMHIHGRYWLVDDQGFLVDASINTSGTFIAQILYEKEVQDVRSEYLI